MIEQHVDLVRQSIGIIEVADAHGASRSLVLIGRTDTASRGADGMFASRLFTRAIKLAMERQDERGVFCNEQRIGRNLHALLLDPVDLGEQRPGIDDKTVAQDGEFTRSHDARRQQRQFERLVVDLECMAGVMPALKTHHHVGAFRQPVHNLTLAFVSPLGADDCNIRHDEKSQKIGYSEV